MIGLIYLYVYVNEFVYSKAINVTLIGVLNCRKARLRRNTVHGIHSDQR